MNNREAWAKAGNYGIAAFAIAIIIGFGLIVAGVISPVRMSTQPESKADITADSSTEATDGQTSDTTADDVAVVAPEQTPPEVTEPSENAPAISQEAEAPTPQDEAQTDTEQAALPTPPVIDLVRLETDGGMLVAGQTQPGWKTEIVLDGVVIATVTPDATGQFAEFLDLEYSDQPRVLSLRAQSPDGQVEMASTGEVILAPTQQPVQTAAADTSDATQGDTGADAQAETQAETETKAETQQESGTQAVLLADESGVKVLQPPEPRDKSPEVMSAVALDAITYSDEGQVQLAGRAIGSGSVRVYLNNAPIITTNIEEDGNWRSELPQVDTGIYTLRVDELDEQGRVTSRVETPFKREDADVLAQAGADQASSKVRAVTVQPGSTLWAISREAYGEGTLYVRVFEANKDRIRDPDLIYPGQVFTIPK